MDQDDQAVAFVARKNVGHGCQEEVIFCCRHDPHCCQVAPNNDSVIFQRPNFLRNLVVKEPPLNRYTCKQVSLGFIFQHKLASWLKTIN